MRFRQQVSVAALLTFAVAGCGTASSTGNATADGSVTIETCGHTETFEQPPERVVAQPQNLAETLVELGVGDRIVGLSEFGSFTPLDNHAAAFESIPTLGSGPLSREVILAQEPDLLLSQINYGGTMVDEFGPLGIPVVFTTLYCSEYAPKDDKGNPDQIQGRYQDIEALGRLFDVTEQATELIDSLKARMDAVKSATQDKEPVKVAMVGFYSGVDGPPWASGGGTLGGELIRAAGGTNIYEDLKRANGVEVNLESLIDGAPDIIVISIVNEDETFEDVRAALREDPRLADIPAVRNDRFTYVENEEVFAGIRFPDAAERLAKAFHS